MLRSPPRHPRQRLLRECSPAVLFSANGAATSQPEGLGTLKKSCFALPDYRGASAPRIRPIESMGFSPGSFVLPAAPQATWALSATEPIRLAGLATAASELTRGIMLSPSNRRTSDRVPPVIRASSGSSDTTGPKLPSLSRVPISVTRERLSRSSKDPNDPKAPS